jgi:GNAT superfamily N-acetyltransferase
MSLDVRLARASERETVLDMYEVGAAEVWPHLTFDRIRAGAVFDRHLADEWPTFLVVTENDTPIGFLLANRADYDAFAGFFISQAVFYVRPDKRGTRAAATLFRRFVRWAESFNPEDIYAGMGYGRRSTVLAARFLRGFGFDPAGQLLMRRRVGSA